MGKRKKEEGGIINSVIGGLVEEINLGNDSQDLSIEGKCWFIRKAMHKEIRSSHTARAKMWKHETIQCAQKIQIVWHWWFCKCDILGRKAKYESRKIFKAWVMEALYSMIRGLGFI